MSVAKLNEQLCFALYSASNHLTSIYRPLLEPLGLTYTQFIVLMALWEKDNISISELAKNAKLSKATMTPLLKRLEQKELIERQMLAGNERQKNIALTDAGKLLSQQSSKITEQAFCMSKLSKEQAETVIEICHQLVNPNSE
ncbi:MarR family winged helix-turn-helix transcriptional regulator [Cognaticolwellia mytili]|uniref:MarR family winged helix-turn-helix transcriptional regulator n=1 Tax=Cognaticolwellia mytili TaxID=1888913 RepID=UPI000A16F9C1|nr:MarR family transcriptional regulator [Cognaticolwellia mytili]